MMIRWWQATPSPSNSTTSPGQPSSKVLLYLPSIAPTACTSWTTRPTTSWCSISTARRVPSKLFLSQPPKNHSSLLPNLQAQQTAVERWIRRRMPHLTQPVKISWSKPTRRVSTLPLGQPKNHKRLTHQLQSAPGRTPLIKSNQLLLLTHPTKIQQNAPNPNPAPPPSISLTRSVRTHTCPKSTCCWPRCMRIRCRIAASGRWATAGRSMWRRRWAVWPTTSSIWRAWMSIISLRCR